MILNNAPATGFINVNKATGVSSAREVAVIKRLTGLPCGHLGTLDPMASGVLPVAVGNATRLFDYFLTKRKRYVAEFTFGIDTDTLDTTGTVLSRCDKIPAEVEIEAVLPGLTGERERRARLCARSSGQRIFPLRKGGQRGRV